MILSQTGWKKLTDESSCDLRITSCASLL